MTDRCAFIPGRALKSAATSTDITFRLIKRQDTRYLSITIAMVRATGVSRPITQDVPIEIFPAVDIVSAPCAVPGVVVVVAVAVATAVCLDGDVRLLVCSFTVVITVVRFSDPFVHTFFLHVLRVFSRLCKARRALLTPNLRNCYHQLTNTISYLHSQPRSRIRLHHFF